MTKQSSPAVIVIATVLDCRVGLPPSPRLRRTSRPPRNDDIDYVPVRNSRSAAARASWVIVAPASMRAISSRRAALASK